MTKKINILLLILFSFFCFMPNTYAEEEKKFGQAEEISEESILISNEETWYQLVINDNANLLTEEEIEKLKEDMQPLTEYGHIAFETINENYTTTEDYAREKYHSLFGTESGSLFLIDMDNRYIYIFSDGENYKYITNSKADIITDNIYTYATRGEYYECASLAYSQMYTILSGGKIAEPMRYISNIILALVIAFFINFMIIMTTARIPSASNNEVLQNCNIDFDIRNVTGSKTGTHKVYSPPSSSGGGSSGGGGGGGGGSSGGGGGHGF